MRGAIRKAHLDVNASIPMRAGNHCTGRRCLLAGASAFDASTGAKEIK